MKIPYLPAAAAFALLVFAGCSSQPSNPSTGRIAVLRFENLGPDPSSDWIGRALSEVVSGELEGAPGLSVISTGRLHVLDASLGRRPLTAPGVSAERDLALASGANRIAYGNYRVRGSMIEAHVTIENPATRQVVDSATVTSAAGDVLGAASLIAQHISGRISPYATRSPEALKDYISVIESTDTAAAPDLLRQAILADPDFGPAYRNLALLKAQQQDRDGALAILDQALARGSLSATERARVQLQAAALRGDPAGRESALSALTAADPTDPATWNDLGLLRMSRHRYADAVAAFRHSVELEPNNPEVLNELGYAAAYSGDFPDADRAIRRYQQLQPSSPNAADSLGDVNLICGKLADAEKFYLAAAKRDPNFYAGLDFLKAALARLMTGDVSGADTVAAQYFAARAAARDPLLDFRKAQWSWLAGRRTAAYQQMEQIAHSHESGPLHEIASLAYIQLSVWSLALENRDAAAAAAEKAVKLADPSSIVMAALARFIAQPPASVEEWQARAAKIAPGPAQQAFRITAVAYALVSGKQYREALPVLQQIYHSGQSTDEGVPILLAWCLVETGRPAEASALLRSYPVLPNTGIGPLMPLYLPRFLDLRARAKAM